MPKFAQIARLNPSFEENLGQAAPGVRFIARDSRGALEITTNGARAILAKRDRKANTDTAIVPFDFPAANWTRIEGEQLLPGTTNLITGNDPAKWRTGLRNFSAVRVREAYPGIDIVFHSKRGSLEFDFEVRPGANPGSLRLRFKGQPATLNADGSISAGALHVQKPVSFQPGDKVIASRFARRAGGQFSIEIGAYDPAKPLIIDPVISYLTYHGGSSSEIAGPIVLDAAGNMYVAGTTTSANFPVSANGVQRTAGGGIDGFISKFAPNGTLVYSTILGGADIDLIQGIAVDSQGSAYFCGASLSPNFPVANPIQAQNKGGTITGDAVFGKLNPAGTALVYSTYYGGNFDETAQGCVIDPEGNLYVAGDTFSDNFPTTQGAFQTANRAPVGFNGFITKINPTGSQAVFSTYLGGTVDDHLYDIAIDQNRNIYVVGDSLSGNYPVAGASQPTNRGFYDAVVTKLAADGRAITVSTFLGGAQRDSAATVNVDRDNNIYVTGRTSSTAFPTTSGAPQRELRGPSDAFLIKFDSSLANVQYSTLFGGLREDDAFDAVVDSRGSLWAIGTTSSAGLTTIDGVQSSNGGSSDAYILKLSPTGDAIQFFTYLGGAAEDLGKGIALDNSGRIFVTGSTRSSNLNPTANAPQKTLSGTSDTFIAIIDSSAAANPFTVSTTRLTFTGAPGATIASQQFNIRAAAGTPEWTIDATTLTGGNWLSATPRTGSGNATIDVRVNTSGVAPGVHEGTLAVNNTRLGSRTVVAVILTVGEPGGEVPNNGVVSAATFTGGGVSPGLLVTIFGSRIGPASLTNAQVTPQGTLATSIAETRVLFDGVAAPLVYASAGQVSAIVPYDVAGKTTTALQVEYRGTRSNAINLRVSDTAPGLFTANSSGKGQGAILNEDSSSNSASNPAKPGSIIVLYGTGEGATDPTGVNGQLANSVFPKPRQPVTVRIGGRNAEVLYAGAAPGMVAGVFQVNVRIPRDVEAGAQPVIVQVGANSSPADVTVAVQP